VLCGVFLTLFFGVGVGVGVPFFVNDARPPSHCGGLPGLFDHHLPSRLYSMMFDGLGGVYQALCVDLPFHPWLVETKGGGVLTESTIHISCSYRDGSKKYSL